MAEVFNWKFEMAAPDSFFVPLEEGSGWEEPATAAKVVCMAMPAPFERTVQDLEALQTEEGQAVLEKHSLELEGIQGMLFLLEFSPVAGNDPEITYSLIFVRPLQNATLIINAQYPKPEHERLYAKLLAAFATVRKKEE